MIDFYNSERNRLLSAAAAFDDLDRLLDTDPTKISWTVNLKGAIAKNRTLSFNGDNVVTALYRPFMKCWLYFSRELNERVYQMPQIFPNAVAPNRRIERLW